MNTIRTKHGYLLLVVVIFLSSQVSVALNANRQLAPATGAEAPPAYQKYAFDRTFPLKDGDDSILTNYFYEFKAYAGQGFVLIDKENVSDFRIYINGTKLEHRLLPEDFKQKDGSFLIGISDLTKDDQNILQVSHIKGENPRLRIRIGFPVVLKERESFKKLDANILNLLHDILEAEVSEGSTGGQLVVLKDGQVLLNKAFGYINNYYPDGTPIPFGQRIRVTDQTLFDLASNTKMYTVNYALQHLVYQKKLSIYDPISKFFPDFKDGENDQIKGKDQLTIKDLLEHQGGFPADPKYFDENYDKDDGITNGKNDLYSQDRKTTMEMVLKTPLQYEPGTKTLYSDVDYMLLGMIIEKVTGQDLDQYMKEEFYRPLRLDRLTFRPLDHGFKPEEIAATELKGNSRDGALAFKNNRQRTIHGSVHDEKAYYSMEGISGHAGLFGNAMQIAQLAQMMLNEGGYGSTYYWDKTTQDLFTKPKDSNSSYGLGWRRQGDGKYSWAFSPMADKSTIGHTGWTGTLTLIDPSQEMVVVLLTNKKNSPVLNKEANPNNFLGDRFLVNRYGMVTSLIYRALHPASIDQTMDLLDGLVKGKEDLIKNQPQIYKNKGDQADLRALKAVQSKYQNLKNKP